MARRLATVGYYVLLPNLYYRAGRDTIFGPDVIVEGSPEHTRMRAIRVTMTIPPVMRDVAAMLAFVDRQDAALLGPVGGIPNHVPVCVPLSPSSIRIASSPTCRGVVANRSTR